MAPNTQVLKDVCDLLVLLATCEREIEIVRQILIEQPEFDPESIFARLSCGKPTISPQALRNLFEAHLKSLSNQDINLLFNLHGNSKLEISYTSFLKLILPNSSHLLRALKIEFIPHRRKPAAISEGEEYALIRVLETHMRHFSSIEEQKELIFSQVSLNFASQFLSVLTLSEKAEYIDLEKFITCYASQPSSEDILHVLRRCDFDKDGRIGSLDLELTLTPYRALKGTLKKKIQSLQSADTAFTENSSHMKSVSNTTQNSAQKIRATTSTAGFNGTASKSDSKTFSASKTASASAKKYNRSSASKRFQDSEFMPPFLEKFNDSSPEKSYNAIYFEEPEMPLEDPRSLSVQKLEDFSYYPQSFYSQHQQQERGREEYENHFKNENGEQENQYEQQQQQQGYWSLRNHNQDQNEDQLQQQLSNRSKQSKNSHYSQVSHYSNQSHPSQPSIHSHASQHLSQRQQANLPVQSIHSQSSLRQLNEDDSSRSLKRKEDDFKAAIRQQILEEVELEKVRNATASKSNKSSSKRDSLLSNSNCNHQDNQNEVPFGNQIITHNQLHGSYNQRPKDLTSPSASSSSANKNQQTSQNNILIVDGSQENPNNLNPSNYVQRSLTGSRRSSHQSQHKSERSVRSQAVQVNVPTEIPVQNASQIDRVSNAPLNSKRSSVSQKSHHSITSGSVPAQAVLQPQISFSALPHMNTNSVQPQPFLQVSSYQERPTYEAAGSYASTAAAAASSQTPNQREDPLHFSERRPSVNQSVSAFAHLPTYNSVSADKRLPYSPNRILYSPNRILYSPNRLDPHLNSSYIPDFAFESGHDYLAYSDSVQRASLASELLREQHLHQRIREQQQYDSLLRERQLQDQLLRNSSLQQFRDQQFHQQILDLQLKEQLMREQQLQTLRENQLKDKQLQILREEQAQKFLQEQQLLTLREEETRRRIFHEEQLRKLKEEQEIAAAAATAAALSAANAQRVLDEQVKLQQLLREEELSREQQARQAAIAAAAAADLREQEIKERLLIEEQQLQLRQQREEERRKLFEEEENIQRRLEEQLKIARSPIRATEAEIAADIELYKQQKLLEIEEQERKFQSGLREEIERFQSIAYETIKSRSTEPADLSPLKQQMTSRPNNYSSLKTPSRSQLLIKSYDSTSSINAVGQKFTPLQSSLSVSKIPEEYRSISEVQPTLVKWCVFLISSYEEIQNIKESLSMRADFSLHDIFPIILESNRTTLPTTTTVDFKTLEQFLQRIRLTNISNLPFVFQSICAEGQTTLTKEDISTFFKPVSKNHSEFLNSKMSFFTTGSLNFNQYSEETQSLIVRLFAKILFNDETYKNIKSTITIEGASNLFAEMDIEGSGVINHSSIKRFLANNNIIYSDAELAYVFLPFAKETFTLEDFISEINSTQSRLY